MLSESETDVLPSFSAGNALAYEQLMGRWSRLPAATFIDFAAIRATGKILDVGCGTGSLVFALAAAAPKATITGIDRSQAYLDFARSRSVDARVAFHRGDAAALPYGDGAFDAAFSLLVLNFISDSERAASEMARVARPGGVLAAAVWDFAGGLPHFRVVIDTAAALDVGGQALRAKLFSSSLTRPGALAAMWTGMGLHDVEQTSLTIRIEFRSLADYWEPWLGGQGTAASLDQERRTLLEHHVRLAYLAGGDDGPRSFAATAWAVRGIVSGRPQL